MRDDERRRWLDQPLSCLSLTITTNSQAPVTHITQELSGVLTVPTCIAPSLLVGKPKKSENDSSC